MSKAFDTSPRGRRSSKHFKRALNFCPKNLSLHLNFAQKSFQHIIYGNGIKTNFRLQCGGLSGPKVAAQELVVIGSKSYDLK